MPGRAEVPDAHRASLEADPWARSLGVEYLEIRRGYCRVALTLAPHMLNFDGAPHGGVIFSLADVAFGTACNAEGAIEVALAMSVSFLSAPAPGTRLIAEGRQRAEGAEASFYGVEVRTEGGALVATLDCVAHPRRARN